MPSPVARNASILDSYESTFHNSFFDGVSGETNRGFLPPDFYPENSSEAGTIGSKEDSDLKVFSPAQLSVRGEPDWTHMERNDFERLREGQRAAQDSTQLGLPPGLKHGEKYGGYEVFDPLNWMLDGLDELPYSYATVQGLDAPAPARKV
jgi:hypothetical protein